MCLVLYLTSVYMCCALYLLMLSNQACVCWFAHHVCLSLLSICFYLIGSFRDFNGLSHFGGVMCFLVTHPLKMCIHEEYHLVVIFQYYLLSLWYVLLMRNSNSNVH